MNTVIFVNGKEIKPEEQKNYIISNSVVNKIVHDIKEQQKKTMLIKTVK